MVHGEQNEMARLKAAIIREYEDDEVWLLMWYVNTVIYMISIPSRTQVWRYIIPGILKLWSCISGEKKWPR